MDFKERLQQPVQYLKGVGPGRAPLLYKLELYRAFDLLFNFPRDYQDFSDRRKVDQLEEKKLQSVVGTIHQWETRETRRGTMTTLDLSGALSVTISDHDPAVTALDSDERRLFHSDCRLWAGD